MDLYTYTIKKQHKRNISNSSNSSNISSSSCDTGQTSGTSGIMIEGVNNKSLSENHDEASPTSSTSTASEQQSPTNKSQDANNNAHGFQKKNIKQQQKVGT